jgi:hypothetical protein
MENHHPLIDKSTKNSAPQRFGPGPTGSPASRQCNLAGCVACVGKKDVGVAKFGTYHPNGIDEYL